MKAICLVGGCSWSEENEHSVPLEKSVEKHRVEKHDWVRPGKLHRFIFYESEKQEKKQGQKVSLRTPKPIKWV